MSKSLYDSLIEYSSKDYYPFHMPGHKRRGISCFNPYDIDITEIEGFDNLHHQEGIIKETSKRLTALYGTKASYLLVNGVTGGLLAALGAVTKPGDRVLLARNSHRAVYGAAIAAGLKTGYVYPKQLGCLMGGIDPEDVENALQTDPKIKAVVITSPTYEGFVSDIKKIAEYAHRHKAVLIVDEAHGAHFRFSDYFPESAISFADIVLHGAHKTLPAFTQSAFLHVTSERVDIDKLQKFLALYQTSSPSYILMAGMDRCISFLENEGPTRFANYVSLLKEARKHINECKGFELIGEDCRGKSAIFDIDLGKLVILPDPDLCTGEELSRTLREKYHLECEMADKKHLIAMTSLMDEKEGFDRLIFSLNETGKNAEIKSDNICLNEEEDIPNYPIPIIKMTLRDAFTADSEDKKPKDALGRISADFIYQYPPGIPIVAPGEEITKEVLDAVSDLRDLIKVVI
ncbi:MAG: aminotransferase class I/II-fold pyridoxal phosphate-dependent enzyme [Lachnospiraceae bacterium]|nr:aminotransferase class I/II-fold pyridoxal phosphate-dependent enzyme [Lachnospiraceae bacterium]